MDIKTIEVKQMKAPAWYYEYFAYAGAVLLLAATLMNPTSVWYPAALSFIVMVWNYLLFGIIKEFIKHLNHSEINKLIATLKEQASKEHKDGTISVHEGLTKESTDEADEDETIS